MFQLQNHQTLVPEQIELIELSKSFERDSFVHFQQIIEPGLLRQILSMIDSVAFEERLTPGIGCVECCTDQRIENGMQALFNQVPVLETVSRIIGTPVHMWGGNTVRRVPGKDHFSHWHNDRNPPFRGIDGAFYERTVPLSVNFSPGPFKGGNLEIRTLPEKTVIADIPNKTPGDAILFKIGDGLQHRVADVTAGAPRLVHVGWFHSRIALKNTRT